MPTYLVQTSVTGTDDAERRRQERRASSAAEALTREGTRVRFGGSVHVPQDELCFLAFEAETAQIVAIAAVRARLNPLRIVEAPSATGKD